MNRGGARPFLVILLLAALLPSCVTTPPPVPVSAVEASPFLESLEKRHSIIAGGITATLDMDFRDSKRHYGGKAFLVLFPPGRFRMEVPGFMGSTVIVIASNGEVVQAFYPKDNRLFTAGARSPVLSDFLPFPLPIEPYWLPELLTGSQDVSQNSPGVKAIEMSDGDTILDLANPWNGQSRYAFHGSSLSYTSRIGKGVYELEMDAAWPHYPGKFTYEAKNVKIKGKFEKIRAAAPPSPATFRIRAPADAEVVVLEARP